MQPDAPREPAARAAEWEDLSRWERAELERALRRLGWSYGEIRDVLPVPKGTLAGWCRDIRLTDDQVAAIRRGRGPPGVYRATPSGVAARRSSGSESTRNVRSPT